MVVYGGPWDLPSSNLLLSILVDFRVKYPKAPVHLESFKKIQRFLERSSKRLRLKFPRVAGIYIYSEFYKSFSADTIKLCDSLSIDIRQAKSKYIFKKCSMVFISNHVNFNTKIFTINDSELLSNYKVKLTQVMRNCW